MAKKVAKPTRLPTRKPGIERYNRIIEAAEALILEAGSLQGITLDAVAKRADVPRVSLYYFFDSIESLMDALYQRGVQKMVAELPQAPQAADWRDMMLLYIDGVRDFYLSNRVVMILALLPVSFVSVTDQPRVWTGVIPAAALAGSGTEKPESVESVRDVFRTRRSCVAQIADREGDIDAHLYPRGKAGGDFLP